MKDKKERINQLARDVMMLSNDTLLVNLRFLDMALHQLTPTPIDKPFLATDGTFLLYGARHVLEMYQESKEDLTRCYLHILLHCIFHHMYMDPSLDRVYWDLASDIAVENIITELNLNAVKTPREKQQALFVEAIRKHLKGAPTAERIYNHLTKAKEDHARMAELRGLFYADNHELWYMSKAEAAVKFGLPMQTPQVSDIPNSNMAQYPLSESASQESIFHAWEKIAKRMQVDLETLNKQYANQSGALVQNLTSVTREKTDYSAFLKKFAVQGEMIRTNEDEFDYIFYTYGLQLFQNIPLIEGLEYKEVKAIHDFVIAIDTSASTSGELVQKFVQKTYNILKTTQSFFKRINLHIIQCDAAIQEDKKITCQEDFDEYLKTMQIRGLGGTDFRVVFEYVKHLQANKEFTNLKGMIYFTDGFGTFPARKPDFDTAFVFVNDDGNTPDVPPWAIKLVLRKDEI